MKPWHGMTVMGMGVLLRAIVQIGESISRSGMSRFDLDTAFIATWLIIGGTVIYFLSLAFGRRDPVPEME